MWLSSIENKEVFRSIYRDKELSLDKLFLHELSVFTGENPRVIVKFDTSELPNELPTKWKIGKVNTLQITMEFIGVTFNSFSINKNNFKNVLSDIEPMGDRKRVRCVDVYREEVFDLEAKWIYLKNISGYQNSEVAL